MSKWMWIKSLFNLSSKARVVGTDLQGNVYSEEIGKGLRPRRSVKLNRSTKIDQYSQEIISPAWTRWLQGLSNDPPTHEELRARVQQAELLQQKVLQRREAEQLSQMSADSAPTSQQVKVVDHASAPSFRSESESRVEPTSTGKTFQPATWQPGSKQDS